MQNIKLMFVEIILHRKYENNTQLNYYSDHRCAFVYKIKTFNH